LNPQMPANADKIAEALRERGITPDA
jgi:hypothetical protein